MAEYRLWYTNQSSWPKNYQNFQTRIRSRRA